ncbi:MAG: amidohydrolase [Clostridia bacterium]|nr:amidohydrolase [Clostridia bacterium]
MNTQEIKQISSSISEKVISLRRELHRFPELGFQEFKTSEFISNYLKSLGLTVQNNVGKTGVVGIITGSSTGKTVAIRADMDALPIVEENTFEFISQNKGVMHACGHDAHVAIALGTAEVLSKLKDSLNGNVKFIFQPGEEGLGGAKYMIDDGVLDAPKVDAIIATHVCPSLPTGSISLRPGPVMASPSEFEVVIKGKGGHAAQHHNTIDPISIGTTLINAFQTILTREKNPLSPAVLSVTYFHAGSSFNIIPDKAVIRGTVRTFDPSLDRYISERMESITSGLSKAMGAEYEFFYKLGYPPVINDSSVVDRIIESSGKIIDTASIFTEPEPSMLGEDFSYYLQKVPGAMYNLGSKPPDCQTAHNLHSSRFTIDEKCLVIGMQLMAQCAVDLLK